MFQKKCHFIQNLHMTRSQINPSYISVQKTGESGQKMLKKWNGPILMHIYPGCSHIKPIFSSFKPILSKKNPPLYPPAKRIRNKIQCVQGNLTFFSKSTKSSFGYVGVCDLFSDGYQKLSKDPETVGSLSDKRNWAISHPLSITSVILKCCHNSSQWNPQIWSPLEVEFSDI